MSDPKDSSAEAGLPPEIEDYGQVIEPCVVAIDYRDRRLGMSFYLSDDRVLYLCHDHDGKPSHEFIQSLLFQVQADTVLFSTRAQDLMDAMSSPVLKFEVRPASEFASHSTYERLAYLIDVSAGLSEKCYIHFGRDVTDREAQRRQDSSYLRSRLGNDTEIGNGCANALLVYIERRRDMVHADHQGQETLLKEVQLYSQADAVMLTADAFVSLGIFHEEEHPNAHAATSKEGLSLFDILNTCKTKHGKSRMRQWFLRPSKDLSILNARHDAVECFRHPQNVQALEQLSQCLRKCFDMLQSCSNLRQGKHGTPQRSEWRSILSFGLGAMQIKSHMAELYGSDTLDIYKRMATAFDLKALQSIVDLISETIDFDETEWEKRMVIRRGVDEELDGHKDVYDGLEHILDKACTDLATIVPLELKEDVRCTYMPQLGFFITVPPTSEVDPSRAVWVGEDWEQSFSTETAIYFKCAKMREMFSLWL